MSGACGNFSPLKIDLQSPEVQFALQTARAGAVIAERVRAEPHVRSLTKSDNSPVTFADMAIQAVAGGFLERYFPESVLVAEESADWLRSPEGRGDLGNIGKFVKGFFPEAATLNICDWIDRGGAVPGRTFWTLDPIDGTRGFLRGGQYVTALALIDGGKLELAALGCPKLKVPEVLGGRPGLLVLAVRGKGCWGTALQGGNRWVPLRVSDCKDVTQARILESMELSHRSTEKSRSIRKEMGIVPDPLPLDSQAKHVVLAMGDAEIFYRALSKHGMERREKIWDVAPGALAIEEAGGRVTDLHGKPVDYSCGAVLSNSPGLVATNGFFHEAVLNALSKTATE